MDSRVSPAHLESAPPNPVRPTGHADLLALSFGTTVGMWALGYACRLFGDAVPPPLIFALLIGCLLAGGFMAGRHSPRGVRGGVYAGLLAGALNLLIVGSLISGDTPNSITAGALLWVPGTLVISALVMGVGAALGAARRASHTPPTDWAGRFALVAVLATFLLLAAGGLVTGFDEGLAVVDWPNTEGYNMFLYPLSRMTGGVYLEHAHRLLGSLVGLTVLVLAVHTHFTENRRWLRSLAWVALGFVILQGVLGGLRVTGRLTFSTNPDQTQPSIVLAIIHGVFGQVIFALLVWLAVVRSRAWRAPQNTYAAPSAGTDRFFGFALIALLIGQLVLGALVRHFTWALDINRYELNVDPRQLAAYGTWALHLHITIAVLVSLLALAVGVRAWGVYRASPPLPRLGRTIMILMGVQLALGIAALVVTGDDAVDRRPSAVDVAITTSHQVVGAALLAWAVMIVLWNYRLLRPATPAVTAVAS